MTGRKKTPVAVFRRSKKFQRNKAILAALSAGATPSRISYLQVTRWGTIGYPLKRGRIRKAATAFY